MRYTYTYDNGINGMNKNFALDSGAVVECIFEITFTLRTRDYAGKSREYLQFYDISDIKIPSILFIDDH